MISTLFRRSRPLRTFDPRLPAAWPAESEVMHEVLGHVGPTLTNPGGQAESGIKLVIKLTRLCPWRLEWSRPNDCVSACVRSVGMEQMWGVIVPALAAAGLACLFAACIWLVRLFLIAPTGYQDRHGFHLGDQGSEADLPPAGLLDHVRRATMVSSEVSLDRDPIGAGARRSAGRAYRQSPKRDAAADPAVKRLSKVGARPPKA